MTEQQTQTAALSAKPETLRHATTEHRVIVRKLRNDLPVHLDRYSTAMTPEEYWNLLGIESGLQRSLEDAHNIEAGVKLLVPR